MNNRVKIIIDFYQLLFYYKILYLNILKKSINWSQNTYINNSRLPTIFQITIQSNTPIFGSYYILSSNIMHILLFSPKLLPHSSNLINISSQTHRIIHKSFNCFYNKKYLFMPFAKSLFNKISLLQANLSILVLKYFYPLLIKRSTGKFKWINKCP